VNLPRDDVVPDSKWPDGTDVLECAHPGTG
jgi:hypothetical protein